MGRHLQEARTITIDGVTFDLTANRSWTTSAAATQIENKTIAQLRLLVPSASVVYRTTDLYKEGFWYYDSADTTTADNTGTVLVTTGGHRIKRILTDHVMATWFGLDPTGGGSAGTWTANSAALQAAINFATLPGSRFYEVRLGGGIFRLNVTITIGANNKGCIIRGIGDEIDYQGAGSVIYWHATSGYVFEMGTDIGGAEDQNIYTGPQAFELHDMHIIAAAGTNQAVAFNSTYNFKVGTGGLKDNRGGNVLLRGVKFQQFEWGSYGVASDFSDTFNCTFTGCKIGQYIGPHSNQQSHTSNEYTDCRTAIELRSCAGVVISSAHFIQCGDAVTATDSPYIKIGSTTNLSFKSIHFINPWFEEGTNTFATGPKPAIFDVSLGDTQTGGVLTIDTPNFYAGKASGGAISSLDHFIRADKVEHISVRDPDGNGFVSLNITHLKLQGTGSPQIKWDGKNSISAQLTRTVTTTGAPRITTNLDQMRLIYANNTPIANSSDTNENTVLTIPLKAYSLGLNGMLMPRIGITTPIGTTNARTFRVKLAGVNILSANQANATNYTARYGSTMQNRNAFNSQIVAGGNSIPGTSDFGQNTAAWTTFAANTATDLNITVTIQNGVAGEGPSTVLEFIQIWAMG